ncbi:MAG: hypothetical protein ACK5X3_14445 [Pseudomonadota bacterium]|jgi:NADH dehydrogenase/NADH:ubiquinone oxidoreductase subunit G|nr:hypothetical protein [Rubrivivax sp.]
MKPDDARAPTAPAGLLEHAKKRTQAVVTKLRAAMKAIESEIDEHEGIYPLNGGKLNQAEVCRRAGISNVTLSTAAHRETTHKMVDAWLKDIKKSTVTGRKSVRRAVTDRAEEWKRAHAAIAQSYRVAELEFLDMKSTVKKLEGEVQKLSNENAALLKLLESAGVSKVVSLAKKSK